MGMGLEVRRSVCRSGVNKEPDPERSEEHMRRERHREQESLRVMGIVVILVTLFTCLGVALEPLERDDAARPPARAGRVSAQARCSVPRSE